MFSNLIVTTWHRKKIRKIVLASTTFDPALRVGVMMKSVARKPRCAKTRARLPIAEARFQDERFLVRECEIGGGILLFRSVTVPLRRKRLATSPAAFYCALVTRK